MNCPFCAHELHPDEQNVCDPCWYGMRLEPRKWAKRLSEAGRRPTARDGCWVPSSGQPIESSLERLKKQGQ